jgi:hypothetical protein
VVTVCTWQRQHSNPGRVSPLKIGKQVGKVLLLSAVVEGDGVVVERMLSIWFVFGDSGGLVVTEKEKGIHWWRN